MPFEAPQQDRHLPGALSFLGQAATIAPVM